MTPARPTSDIEQRVLEGLERATARGTALSTRLVAKRAFHRGTSRAQVAATRQALRSLEWKGFARRIFQGEGLGESIWTHVPLSKGLGRSMMFLT
jgi:hypothetical protein